MSDASTVVMFEGGLDMVTPIQNTAPGTLVSCLNYEVGPIKGYRRIDGYERFDGSLGGGISTLYRVEFSIYGGPGAVLVPGAVISSGATTYGAVTHVEPPYIYYAPSTPGVLIEQGSNYSVRLPSTLIYPGEAFSPSQDSRLTSADYDEYITRMRAASSVLRQAVRTAPRNIAGVYFGREHAFAVVDCWTVNTVSASAPLVVGQYVRIFGEAYEVADVEGYRASLIHLGQQSYVGNDFEIISLAQLSAGTGNLSVVTDISDWIGDIPYGQPYRVDGEYIPIQPTKTVTFDTGGAAFGDRVRIDDGSVWALYDVESYQIDQGTFGTSDAAGVLYLGQLVNASVGFAGTFLSPAEVQDAAGNVTLADVVSIIPSLWAGTGALRDKATKNMQTFYQWGTYNFKASRGHERIYATSGASRAGWISAPESGGTYYGNIVTDSDILVDRPRYLSYHAGQRLLLAFANGSIQMSAVGEPLNFSGLDGAAEIGNGDNITGVSEAQGDSTIVYGPRTIRRLVGTGTDLQLNTISSESGAFDYTCAVVAGLPMYINHNGLCSLEQTSAYGDFSNSSISGMLDPFFTPRIVQDAYSVELGGTVCAFPVRAKNQYRVFLGDGSVVSMAITATGAQPMLSNYAPATGDLRVPLAYSSSVSDIGSEYVLTVWDADRAAAAPLPSDNPPASNLIYRMDHGWGFDGLTFDHHIDTTYMFNQDPTFLTIDKAILYGMGYGAATLQLRAAGVEDDFDQDLSLSVQDISLPRNPEILSRSLKRVMGEVDHANWGRAVKLRIQNIEAAGQPTTEPSHFLQSTRLFIQTAGIPEN